MKALARTFIVVFSFSVLVGCAPEFKPAPDYVGGFLWNEGKSKTITVQKGDTLYTVSRRYNVPTKAIIARNGLKPPFELREGQTLYLDPARSHLVESGDTLSQLARDYGVEMRLIAAANDLVSPYTIYIGQSLWIPDPFTVAAAPVSAELPPVKAALVSSNTPRSAPITRQDLAPPPGSAPPQTLEPMPPSPPQPATSQEQLSSPVQEPASMPPPGAQPSVPQQTVSLPPAVSDEGPKPLTEPPPRSAARFMWPLSGKVISGYGPSGKGLHNDGINIAADAGAQVKAADNGIVAYAGNELKGFGNLLLIKHSDGWITAYAHNDKLLVRRGDQVSRGQIISTVGRTGNVETPQLHFEVRKGTQAVDPLKQLDPA